ncbi:hypothetical protein [Shewanella sp. S1-49-MNA-CIBAN-0167]|uniref:hypothetical protein n=1 Tax=Shewanella sp. S1-49-MNA-CIBAN-0167 TaxID=3140468 RepID=UPI0033292DDA
MRHRNFIPLILVIFFSFPAFSDMFTPSPSCSKPYKPYEFTSQWQIDSFNDDVMRYKQCIADFVAEMNEASEKHLNAAEDAIEEWNQFVNYELN